MTTVKNWGVTLDLDNIHSQGPDPSAIRKRNSRLVSITEKALEEGLPFIEPVVLYESFKVEDLQPYRLLLDRKKFSGPLISRHLRNAVERLSSYVRLDMPQKI